MLPFTEKRINRLLNILLRCPGLLMWMSFGHVAYTGGFAARHWRTASAAVQQEQMEMPLPALLFMCANCPPPALTICNTLACTCSSLAMAYISWTGWWALTTNISKGSKSAMALQKSSSNERSGKQRVEC